MIKEYVWKWRNGNPHLLYRGKTIAVLEPVSLPRDPDYTAGWYVKTLCGTQNSGKPVETLRKALRYAESLFYIRKIEVDTSNIILHIPPAKTRK